MGHLLEIKPISKNLDVQNPHIVWVKGTSGLQRVPNKVRFSSVTFQ